MFSKRGFRQGKELTVELPTVRVVLTLAVSYNWQIHQIDINNAFLNGDLHEKVYMAQPEGFVDSSQPQHVCKLHKALYGLKNRLHVLGLTSSSMLYLNGVSQTPPLTFLCFIAVKMGNFSCYLSMLMIYWLLEKILRK